MEEKDPLPYTAESVGFFLWRPDLRMGSSQEKPVVS